MPVFISEEELRLYSNDGVAVAERADAFIRDLVHQRDTVRAEADAAAIAAEQTAALLEQRYTALSIDVSCLQSENAQLSAAAEQRLSELADAQAEKHQLHLKAIGKDGEMERLSLETAELHKSKRQLLELLEQKDIEIQEKNSVIQSYLEKIVNLTDDATSKEARLHELDAELSRCNSMCNRFAQEKGLLEKHNAWLNEELSAKVNSLVELRRKCMETEAELSAKLTEGERQLEESSNALKQSQERAKDLELRVISLEKDLYCSKEAASATEARFATELATATKLADLYKASSEEWSRKAGELEGVIKALEAHLSQVENDCNEKLDKSMSVRQDLEKEVVNLREKLATCEAEIEKIRKANELGLVPISDFHASSTLEEVLASETFSHENCDANQVLVPKIPRGVSGTALAASLLRDGWSLAKMYEKYQEAADALRHEKWGRKHSEAILERVLHEIEEKADIILDERAEHERMVEAYTLLNQKLQQSLLEHDNYENIIRNLKSELKRHERDYMYAQKEIDDLQKQVAVLLKECQDIQLRCGITTRFHGDSAPTSSANISNGIDTETIISDQLLTFKDINGLVEQNAKLRRLVCSLSNEEEKRVAELREGFQIELQKVTDEAASKVEAVLNRSEEQGRMIESLHCSVAMYKRLYEEERKTHLSNVSNSESIPGDEKRDLMLIFDSSQEISKKAHEQLSQHARNLEKDLEIMRNELMSLRSEHERLKLDEKFACERLDSFRKEYELQRQEANEVSARNVELSNMVVDYQKRLRANSDSLQASEENLCKLTMEVSILKHEKEILVNSEKRATDEVRSLSERVYRLQSALDTIQSTNEVREDARATERRKLEEQLRRTEREWAEAKKELQEERDHVRNLTLDREKVIENSLRQVEEMRKELADAWHSVASAESRVAVAEARCSDLEMNRSRPEMKVKHKDIDHDHMVLSTVEVAEKTWKEKEELEKLKEEARVNKDYMLQYKEIACTNEVALKQIEVAHEQYKAEAEKLKKALEADISSLKDRIYELERSYALKCEEAASAVEAKEKAISSSSIEISGLKIEIADKVTQLNEMGATLSSLKEDLDKEHIRWRTAQDNYERQVILLSETIQELTSTSKTLSTLESENVKLRKLSEMQRTEIEVLKSSWEDERLQLQASRNEAEKKYNEANEHNKVLLNQLESLHIRLADKERTSAGLLCQSDDSQASSDLQSVLSYLRRSKEIAETEISLLKQEKLRLQSQLESALKASESAQALLHSQCENSKAVMLKDEEFKSLQLQVREISLLRESNMQIREENKHNFEECQKLRQEVHKAKLETENISKNLCEKQIEYDACLKEIEMLKMETENLNKRNAELLESCKNIDVAEYERMKNEFLQNKVLLNDKEAEIQETRPKLSEMQCHTLKLEQDLAKCQSELGEQTKSLNDAIQREAHLKSEHKKQLASYKKRNETIAKEIQDLTNENRALAKQIEESKSIAGRKSVNDIQSDQATIEKEKDARLQILEKTLERERSKRQKNETQMINLAQNVKQNKEKVEDELAKHKQAIAALVESKALSASQLPSTVLEERTTAYFLSVASIEEIANSVQNDSGGTQSTPAEVSTTEASASTLASGRKVPTQQMRIITPHAKAMEDKNKGLTIPKPSEVRKGGRKLVRPSLDRPEEVTAEIEMSVMEGTTVTEGKGRTSHEPEHPVDTSLQNIPSSGRKRPAPSLPSNVREEAAASDDAKDDVAPQLKKSKGTDYVQNVYEGQSIPSSSENPEAVQQSIPQSTENIDVHQPIVDMEADHALVLPNEGVDVSKDEQDNVTTRGEMEDHHPVMKSSINIDEVQEGSDQNAEDISDKLRGAVESLDELPKSVDECPKSDGKEMLQSKVQDDDEREEGELMPDDSEQPQDGVSGECQHDSIAGEESGMGDENVDTVEVSSPAVLDEIAEGIDVIEEGGQDSDMYNRNNDQGSVVIVQSSQTSPGAQEGSSSVVTDDTALDQQSPSPATGKEESRSGRTISINESARQNSLLRLSNRGRGRGGLGRMSARGGRRAGRG